MSDSLRLVRASAACATALVATLAVLTACAFAAAPPERAARHAARFAPAESLVAQGRYGASQAFLDSMLAEARRSGPPGLLVEALIRHGGAAAFVGRQVVAEPELREAERLATAHRDTLAQLRALNWRAVGLERAGRVAESARVYERLARLAHRAGRDQLEGRALTGLAYADLLAGRTARAKARYTRALVLLRRAGDRAVELTALVGLGRAEKNLGDDVASEARWAEVAERARASNLPNLESDALNNLGTLAYARGDAERAVEHWQRALQLASPLLPADSRLTILGNLARATWDLGRAEDAWRVLDGAESAVAGASHANVTALRAEIRLAQERPLDAARLCREVLAREDSLPVKPAVELRLLLADALLMSGDAPGALAQSDTIARRHEGELSVELRAEHLLTRGRALLASARPADAIASLDRALLAARSQRWVAGEIAIERALARAELRLGHRTVAQEHLRVAAARWERHRALGRDPRWREARGTTGRRIATEWAEVLLDPRAGGPRGAAAAKAFDVLQRFKARTLEERARGPATPALLVPGTSAAALRRGVLRAGEVFLDLYASPDTAFVFAVSRSGVNAWGVSGDDALAPRVARYRALLAHAPADGGAASAAMLDTAGRALGALVLGPGESALRGARRLIVSPDGALASVPFGTLGAAAAQGALEVVECPSAATLARLRAVVPRPRAAAPLLAVGPARDETGAPLAGAARELDGLVARFARAERLPRGGEGAAAVARAMRRADVLHVAAHAEPHPRQPWDSAMLVGAGEDRWLRASSVAALRLNARLCVLSCCGSREGSEAGEGVGGLAAGFLCAGVPSVVATYWPIDDQRTTAFMQDFYESLASGRTAARALADARAAARARPATRHPYWWAGFTLVGEPDTRVELRAR